MIGRRLAHYEISAKLGEGGMGEVYRARDSKLGRDVALKLLPQNFSADPERLARMQREAKLLASLNHTGIATIHGLEEDGGSIFLVMELAEGEDLSERIRRGPIPLDEALDIARQMAEGLQEAHAKGVVHRDLKPANIKVSPEGKVKILDFGLARAYAEQADPEVDPSLSPTITSLHTQAGTILGTAAYMSPEQARGLPADKRADIWAFGVILSEMLTGRQLFEGDTASDMLASILKIEPDWNRLPPSTPPRIRELLERCLAKSRRDRMQDIGDVRVEIEWAQAGRSSSDIGHEAKRAGLPLVPTVAGALLLAIVAAALAWNLRSVETEAAPPRPYRLSFATPEHLVMTMEGTAPDGTFAMVAQQRDSQSRTRMYLRPLDQFDFQQVNGVEGIRGFGFSHDSRWLAVVAPDQSQASEDYLWKIPVDQSAPPLRLIAWPDAWQPGIHWLRDGNLLAMTYNNEFLRISGEGQVIGSPVPVEPIGFNDVLGLERSQEIELPDGIHTLHSIENWTEAGYARHVVLANTQTGEARVIVENAASPRWLDGGFLLFARHTGLLAQRFDLDAMETRGGPVAVEDGLLIRAAWIHGTFGLSKTGQLVYAPGGLVGEMQTLAWTDASFDDFTPWSDDRRSFDGTPILSPDGKTLCAVIAAPSGVYETWISDVEQPALRRFLFQRGADCQPTVFTPDSRELIYVVRNQDKVETYSMPLDGSSPRQLLFENASRTDYYNPTAFADGGASLLVDRYSGGSYDILLYPYDDESFGKLPDQVLLQRASSAAISPDGRWLAYEADTAGPVEIFVRRWLGNGEMGPEISVDQGFSPAWYQPGPGAALEIWYSREGKSYGAALSTEPTLRLGKPRSITEFDWKLRGFRILRDGRILAWRAGDDEEPKSRLNIVLNWGDEVRRKMDAVR